MGTFMALSGVTFQLFDDLRHEFDDDQELCAPREDAANGLPTVEGKLFLALASACLPTTIEAAHGMGA
jgi:hypothetical protein